MKNRMIPALYAEEEGGSWKLWPQHFAPPMDFYQQRARRSGRAITICLARPYIKVHALVTPAGYRWDCVNGWTGKTFAKCPSA